ncbi:hypothetical protein EON63_24685 [archaeon]|nr:MAG: hypothetical protein EON63_24685 [archaeon]
MRGKVLVHTPSNEVITSYSVLEHRLLSLGWERYYDDPDLLQYHKRSTVHLISLPHSSEGVLGEALEVWGEGISAFNNNKQFLELGGVKRLIEGGRGEVAFLSYSSSKWYGYGHGCV